MYLQLIIASRSKRGFYNWQLSLLLIAILLYSIASVASDHPRSLNISAVTGERIVGDTVAWQTPNGDYIVEHLAGRNEDNDLIVFYWQADGQNWRSVNVSNIVGKKITSDLTSWQTPNGQYNVEHLAGRGEDGSLLVFYWQPDGLDWRVVNVSSITGQYVDGSATSWQTPNGQYNVEHLAARNQNDELLVFYWQPDGLDWRVVNVSNITGETFTGNATSWQTSNGRYNVEHLAGRGEDGSLLVFYWQPDGLDWRVVNVTEITGQRVSGDAVSWQNNNNEFLVENIAIRSPNNDLLRFYWQPDGNDWQFTNISVQTGIGIKGTPTVYTTNQEEVLLGARSMDNELLNFYQTPKGAWKVHDLTLATGNNIANSPTGWVVPVGRENVEHLAATSTDGSLYVFWNQRFSRALIRDAMSEFAGVKETIGNFNMVSILWDPARPDHPAPDIAVINDLIYGVRPSATDYFVKNSSGLANIENVGIFGWYDSARSHEYYWGPRDDRDTNGDGWVRNHYAKWAEAVQRIDPEFNFSLFDDNNDLVLTPDELMINIVVPQTRSGGVNRRPLAREWPSEVPLVVDGVRIPVIVETYINKAAPSHYGLVAHEIAHAMLGIGDMYPAPELANKIPFKAGKYSLMDRHWGANHIDAVHKLKLGWLQPQLIHLSDTYCLSDVSQRGAAFLLMDPSKSTDEYFVLENRSQYSDYDANLPDHGLAIWHVIQDSMTFSNTQPPDGLTDDQLEIWHRGDNDWARRGIQQIRPMGDGRYNDSRALWSNEEVPPGMLYWANGDPSGFTINSVSAAAEVIKVAISTPHNRIANRDPIDSCTQSGSRPPEILINDEQLFGSEQDTILSIDGPSTASQSPESETMTSTRSGGSGAIGVWFYLPLIVLLVCKQQNLLRRRARVLFECTH